MIENKISVTVPEEVTTQVLTALNQIKTLLQPYVHSLTVEERSELPKMRDKSLSFVSKIDSYCSSNPEFIPSFMNAEELDKDFKAVSTLKPVLDIVDQIQSNVSDTVMLAGSEAYMASLAYYANVQMFAKTGQPNAKPIYDDLKERFAGMGKKAKPAPATV